MAAAEEERDANEDEAVVNASRIDCSELASRSGSGEDSQGGGNILPDSAAEPARHCGQSVGRRKRKEDRLERKRKKDEVLCVSMQKKASGESKAARTDFQLVSVAPDGCTSLVKCW